jgi:transposase InsO family protein
MSLIEPGSPWQNGFCESFNGKMRNEGLNINICSTVLEADFVIRDWVKYYNPGRTVRSEDCRRYRRQYCLCFSGGLMYARSYIEKWYKVWGQARKI